MFGKMRGERKSTPVLDFLCVPRLVTEMPAMPAWCAVFKTAISVEMSFWEKGGGVSRLCLQRIFHPYGIIVLHKGTTRKWRILMITWKTPMLKRRVSHQNEVIHDCWMVSLLHSNNTSLFPTTASLPPFYNEVIFCWELMKRFDDHVSVLTRTFDGFNLILYFELWIDCTITTICSTSPSIQWLLW